MKTASKYEALFAALDKHWSKLVPGQKVQFIDYAMAKASDVLAINPEMRKEYEGLRQEILAKAA